jgi:hypothetical protein
MAAAGLSPEALCMHTKRRITFLAATAVAALTPATASADTRVVVEKNVKLERAFEDTFSCAFGFTERYAIRRTIVEVYDDAGELLRERITVKFTGSETHHDTGGTLPIDGTRNIVADHEAGTWTESGVMRHVTAPGEGIVLQDAGRVVEGLESEELIEMAGHHQLRTGDMGAFCAALASA